MRWFNNSLMDGVPKFGSSWYWNADKYLNSTYNIRKVMRNRYLDELPQTGWLLSHHFGTGRACKSFLVNTISISNVYKLQYELGSTQNMLQDPSTLSRTFVNSIHREDSISRDWLVKLWLVKPRKKNGRRQEKQRSVRVSMGDTASETLPSFQMPSIRSVFSRIFLNEHETQVEKTVNQPPISQLDGGSLSPNSPEEVKLEPLLARANLLIIRDIEWANLMFAFEQESRYAIMDPYYPQATAGYICEQSNAIVRQLLRSRRPFVASITDGMGNEIFRVRRPFWWINSTIYVEVGGKVVGAVHSRWHLWRRIYDLYLGNKQFAVVENPGFWNWTFTLTDDNDNVLAQIDRDWRGFGFELFTDAGQYVIRFGDADAHPKSGPISAIQELEVARPLTLSERAVALALAVSLDCDYFSRRGGWGLPIFLVGE